MWNLIVTIGVGARDVKVGSREGTNRLFPLQFHHASPLSAPGAGGFDRHRKRESDGRPPTI